MDPVSGTARQKIFIMKPSPVTIENISSFESLFAAYRRASKGRKYGASVLVFERNLENNLAQLSRELRDGTYRPGPYRIFIVLDSKKRTICAAPFRDRVVHHAICEAIEPIFECRFVEASYACRVGKGAHAAVRKTQTFLCSLQNVMRRSDDPGPPYCLSCDISKFFANIDHAVLCALIHRHVRDEKVFRLISLVIESYASDDAKTKGIPIGNLTSQLFANLYLNELDHFIKEKLRIRYYVRYMDDVVIFGADRTRLVLTKDAIQEFLATRLRLSVHPHKVSIRPILGYIDFLGYRIALRGYRQLRRSTIRRFAARLKSERGKEAKREVWRAWNGYAGFAKARHLRMKMLWQYVLS
jgi:retron-type reverse transcriptase